MSAIKTLRFKNAMFSVPVPAFATYYAVISSASKLVIVFALKKPSDKRHTDVLAAAQKDAPRAPWALINGAELFNNKSGSAAKDRYVGFTLVVEDGQLKLETSDAVLSASWNDPGSELKLASLKPSTISKAVEEATTDPKGVGEITIRASRALDGDSILA